MHRHTGDHTLWQPYPLEVLAEIAPGMYKNWLREGDHTTRHELIAAASLAIEHADATNGTEADSYRKKAREYLAGVDSMDRSGHDCMCQELRRFWEDFREQTAQADEELELSGQDPSEWPAVPEGYTSPVSARTLNWLVLLSRDFAFPVTGDDYMGRALREYDAEHGSVAFKLDEPDAH